METIDKLLQKTPKIIRWVLAPILALVIGFLAQALIYIAFNFGMYFSHIDPLNPFYKICKFCIEVTRSGVTTGAFVVTFMYIVPRYKKVVGIVSLCLVVSLLSIASFIVIAQENYGNIGYWLSTAAGLIGAGLSLKLYIDTLNKEVPDKEF